MKPNKQNKLRLSTETLANLSVKAGVKAGRAAVSNDACDGTSACTDTGGSGSNKIACQI